MFSSSKLPNFRLYFFIVIYEVIGIGINSKLCEKWGNRDLRAGAKLYRPNLTAEDYSLPGCEGVIFIDGSRVFGKCQFIRTMRLLPPFSKMDCICTMTTAGDYPFRRPVINLSNVNRSKSNYLPSIIDLLLWVKTCQKSRINE